jgi:aminopeptidase-like protein
MKQLFPFNRSLTGEGTLKTLKVIQKILPKLKIKNIKSGEKVFDWIVPDEWNVKEAYIQYKKKKKLLILKIIIYI